MKISIFPEAKAHPSSKAEKASESFKVSKPYLPQTVGIVDEHSLIKYITNYAWSPFIFDGVRHAENFISCDFLVYDIDEGLTLEQAEEKLEKCHFCYLVLPSPSHSPENHRFRVIIPLAHSIFDEETYAQTWDYGAKLLGTVDEQTKDLARYYFGSIDNGWGFWDFTKDFLTPIKAAPVFSQERFTPSQTLMLSVDAGLEEMVEKLYGKKRDKIPEAVHYFLVNANSGIPGNWTNSLNAAVFSLALSNVEEDVIIEVLEPLCPDGAFDKKDWYQVKRAIRDGKKHSEI